MVICAKLVTMKITSDVKKCDAVIHYDDACYHEDEEYHDHPYCRKCFDMDEIIHDYYYKPEPIFYGDGRDILGVELELDDLAVKK